MRDLPDIWTRLARLDSTCHVTVHSLFVPGPDGAGHREWEVLIRFKGLCVPDPIRVQGSSLKDAITLALERAEASGNPPSAVAI